MEAMVTEVIRVAAVLEKLPVVQRLRTQVERLNQMLTAEACKCEAAEREASRLRMELASALFETELEREAHNETRRQRDGWSTVAQALAVKCAERDKRIDRLTDDLDRVRRAEPGLVEVPYA